MDSSSPPGVQSHRIDSILSALADDRRRLLVQYLRTVPDGVATFDDAVAHVLSQCSTDTDAESLLTYFVHIGLPKLRDAGLIEYDQQRRTVSYTPVHVADCVLDCVLE